MFTAYFTLLSMTAAVIAVGLADGKYKYSVY